MLALVHPQSYRGVAESCHIQGKEGLRQDEDDEEENSEEECLSYSLWLMLAPTFCIRREMRTDMSVLG